MSHPAIQLAICLLHTVMMVGIGMGIARLKNRSLWVGALLGFFLGFIGLIILLCLKKVEPCEVPPGSVRERLHETNEEWQRR
jgi:hypothetical protein